MNRRTRQNWNRGCHSKTRYHDREQAKRARAHCERQRPGKPLRIYECHHCNGFHLTSSHVQSREAPQTALGGAE